jgi:nucleoside-triphosphatase THEP1
MAALDSSAVTTRLFILTGEIESGKTSWLLELLRSAATQGLKVSGLVSPAVFEAGHKIGIDALLLPQHQRMSFATLAKPQSREVKAGCNHEHVKTNNPRLKWNFNEQAIAEINKHFAKLSADLADSLLIIDELGPLELLRDQGFTAALELLDNASYSNALIVVRPSLVENAQQRWPVAEVIYPTSSLSVILGL